MDGFLSRIGRAYKSLIKEYKELSKKELGNAETYEIDPETYKIMMLNSMLSNTTDPITGAGGFYPFLPPIRKKQSATPGCSQQP